MAERPAEATTSTALAATPTAGQAGIGDVRAILIVAGVSGSGKTTIATALAQRLGLPFKRGGQLHPPPDIAKVHSAHPLDDREQWSWLEKIAAWIDGCRQLGTGGVVTSPALKRSHRDFLTRGRPDVRIVYLHGERALIASRLAAREENSMLLSLLDLQFSILEAPEPDEELILIDVGQPVEDIVAEILLKLTPQVRENPLDVVARDSSERPAPPPVTPCGPQTHPSTGTLAGRGPFIGSDLPLDIEDYALIGDCTTAALVGRNGSIDWLCWPRFDSGALFAALLGTSEHGRWRISPADPRTRTSRAYHEDTLVLETVFDTADGSVALIDFMPIGQGASSVIRLVKGRRGKVAMQMHLALRFDYGVTVPWVTQLEDGSGVTAIAGANQAVLRSPVPLQGKNFATVAEFDVVEGECVPFVLTRGQSHLPTPPEIDWNAALQETESFWRDWSNRCSHLGPWREAVKRSLLTLKALTYAETGGIVAALTTSLPEQLRGNAIGITAIAGCATRPLR
jgi:carbohydrate kinase (thermoresistant glucokinase family)